MSWCISIVVQNVAKITLDQLRITESMSMEGKNSHIIIQDVSTMKISEVALKIVPSLWFY